MRAWSRDAWRYNRVDSVRGQHVPSGAPDDATVANITIRQSTGVELHGRSAYVA